MTIAAGFIASDGILLCADSQFTGAEKDSKDKIILEHAGHAVLAFAIAGNEDYARTAVYDAIEAVSDLRGSVTLPNVRAAIRAAIKEVIKDYDKQRLPRESQPEFIVGIGMPKGNYLFSASQTAFSPIQTHDFRGTGGYLGKFIVNDMFGGIGLGLHKVMDFLPAALFAVLSAKKHDAYCGGGTQFAVVRNMNCTTIYQMPNNSTDSLIDYHRFAGALFSSLCNTDISEEEFASRIEWFKEIVMIMRKETGEETSYGALVHSLREKKIT